MIRKLRIRNYKSILDHKIELGRVNVFIGENGSGKTNLLEALAFAGAAATGRLDVEELYNRGVRVAKPAMTLSSFLGMKSSKAVEIDCRPDEQDEDLQFSFRLTAAKDSAAEIVWENSASQLGPDPIGSFLNSTRTDEQGALDLREAVKSFLLRKHVRDAWLQGVVGQFVVYNPNILGLRGLQVVSRRTPLGIYGENLDVAISAMSKKIRENLVERARVISWLDDVLLDKADELKFEGHKLGRSTSTLYFRDRFMRRRNNIFSAENANEGILHVLFHLALFLSDGTPKVFGIDNIETALNPQLCRDLMKQLVELAKKHDKQALITTHNPAVIDGLNLNDDEQRLFVVSRNDEGHTVTERIKVKPQAEEGKLKLSELWMRGYLGGLPQKF